MKHLGHICRLCPQKKPAGFNGNSLATNAFSANRTETMKPDLFSYVVDHDLGYSPNPFGRFCTLAYCKFSTSKQPNIVELAQEGDWVAGTGGLSSQSAGHGRLIYAMRVTERLTLKDYFSDPRFRGRADNHGADADNPKRFALISNDFFYFGTRSVSISAIPTQHLNHPFEKRGVGFRSDFSGAFISDFSDWLRATFRRGVHAQPHGGRPTHAPQTICSRTPPSHALQRTTPRVTAVASTAALPPPYSRRAARRSC
jgi:hypothetical protein